MKTNRDLLKSWINLKKKEDRNIESKICQSIRISNATLRRLMYKEGALPSPQTRLLLAQYTGIKEELLFPITTKEAA